MYTSKKRGEITSTLAIISVITILMGVLIGRVNISSTQTIPNRAQEQCTYNAVAKVIYETYENGQLKYKALTEDANGGPMYIENDKKQKGNLNPISASYGYRTSQFTFSPYTNGARAWVELHGLNTQKWQIKAHYCDPDSGSAPGIGCPTDLDGDKPSLDSIINGFHVICGVNISYGWIVEPVAQTTPEPEPTTPQPTSTPRPTATLVPTNTPIPTSTPTTPRPTNRPTSTPTTRPTEMPSATPEPSITPAPSECNNIAVAGGNVRDEKIWKMGRSQGTFLLSYSMLSAEDKLEIYHGNTLIYTTNGFVSGFIANKEVQLDESANLNEIRVTVTGNAMRPTEWFYSIGCPQNPNPTVGPACRSTTGTISGKLTLDTNLPQICNQTGNKCIFNVYACPTIRADPQKPSMNCATNARYAKTIAQGPDYEYTLSNIPSAGEVGISVDKYPTLIDNQGNTVILNAESDYPANTNPITENCMKPRQSGYYFNNCFLQLRLEPLCNAENTNFKVIGLSPRTNPHPLPPTPLQCSNLTRVVQKTLSLLQSDQSWNTWNNTGIWEAGIALAGLMEVYEKTGDQEIIEAVQSWMDKHIVEIERFVSSCGGNISNAIIGGCVDDLHPNFASPAWALVTLNKYQPNTKYANVINFFANYLANHAPRYEGAITHAQNQIWADTLAMTVPFFARYAHETNNMRYFDLAVQDLLAHHDKLEKTGQQTGQWHHGWALGANPPCRSCSQWARGNAWIALSTSELLKYLPTTHPQRTEIEEMHIRHLKSVAQTQDQFSSLWHTVITRNDFYTETSGSAGIAASLLRSLKVLTASNDQDTNTFAEAGNQTFAQICETKVAPDGTVLDVSTGTGFPPEELTMNVNGQMILVRGEDIYNHIPRTQIEPYGQGLFLFMAVADDDVVSQQNNRTSPVQSSEENKGWQWVILQRLKTIFNR